jgi:AcrR family transcriptional regulator
MSTSRKTRAEMAHDTAARLIATARTAFATEGFAQVSLDALALRAGVTRGALHHHFTNKSGLFEAVLRAVDAEMSEVLQRHWDSGPDPWGGLRQSYHLYLDLVLAPDRRRILFQDAPAVLGLKAYDILLDSGFRELVEDLRGYIRDGHVRALNPEALAHMLNGATMNLAFWAAEAPEGEDRITPAHATLDALFDGLAPTA